MDKQPFRFRRKARTELLWVLAGVVALHGALALWVEWGLPATVRDPDFAFKLTQLRARLAETPNARLILALGSSRTLLGWQAGRLTKNLIDRPTVAFNFALAGAGPRLHRVFLRRLLDEGIRPDWLLVEVIPFFMNEYGGPSEDDLLQASRLDWDELALVRGYSSTGPGPLYKQWLLARGLAVSRHAGGLREYLTVDDAITGDTATAQNRRIDGHGWMVGFAAMAPEDRRRYTDLALRQYSRLYREFRLAEGSVRALEDLIALARANGSAVVVLLAPESSEFRALYTPDARSQLDALLARLHDAGPAAVIDARDWVPDAGFWDGHHLMNPGANLFSIRLENRVIRPLLGLPQKKPGKRPKSPSPPANGIAGFSAGSSEVGGSRRTEFIPFAPTRTE